eukprot:COSAG02_NODE_24380_length_690_cov_0.915398_2_plen_87_part_00
MAKRVRQYSPSVDKSIVIIDTDKNLGLAADDRANYMQHCLDELARTHARLTESADYILRKTLSAMKAALEPFLGDRVSQSVIVPAV